MEPVYGNHNDLTATNGDRIAVSGKAKISLKLKKGQSDYRIEIFISKDLKPSDIIPICRLTIPAGLTTTDKVFNAPPFFLIHAYYSL